MRAQCWHQCLWGSGTQHKARGWHLRGDLLWETKGAFQMTFYWGIALGTAHPAFFLAVHKAGEASGKSVL